MCSGKWAEVFPDKSAVIDSATGARRSYGELNDRSNQLAQLLYDRGLRRGDHISVFAGNHIGWFDVVWDALRSGLCLTTVNRHLTDEKAGYIVDNSESQVLVTTRSRAGWRSTSSGTPPAVTRGPASTAPSTATRTSRPPSPPFRRRRSRNSPPGNSCCTAPEPPAGRKASCARCRRPRSTRTASSTSPTARTTRSSPAA